MNARRGVTGTLVAALLGGCGNDSAAPSDTDGGRDTADVAADLTFPDVTSADAAETAVEPVATCVAVDPPNAAGTDHWDDTLGRASVVIADRDTCARTYTLASTAPQRDSTRPNPRIFTEGATHPVLRSGNDLFDALYALAMAEVDENAVDAVSDGAFDGGAAMPCGDGGCFETGRLWKYVWTRDIAYAVHLGLGSVDPVRSVNALRFKLSPTRDGERSLIVQDTGTGGSYPVSSDRVAWALGLEAVLAELTGEPRDALVAEAYDALRDTIAQDRVLVFDPVDGLYRGETSFLDWREQTYPAWVAEDVGHIGMSKALGTNVLHHHALGLASRLAAERGDDESAARYLAWADALGAAIRDRFWLEDEGLFASYTTTTLDPSPVHRFDLLGSALAVLLGVADTQQAARVLERYPHVGAAAPVIWPQQQQTPIYHNRAQWPFVTAYWLRAAATVGNDAVADRMIRALIRGAALNLSNMENLEAVTGAPWVDDGPASGPVVNSERQLWSVAGYLSMVHQTLFGLHPTRDGLLIRPFGPASIRGAIFGGSRTLTLHRYPFAGDRFDITLKLPEDAGTGVLRVGEIVVDGVRAPAGVLSHEVLSGVDQVEVQLLSGEGESTIRDVDISDWRALYGPRIPRITGLAEVDGQVAIDLATDEPADVTLDIYKDGVRVAEGLAGTTTRWLDEGSAAAGDASPCYSVAARFTASGNASQHAQPACWWGRDNGHIQTLQVASFEHVGGALATTAGRQHFEAWGDAGHSLTSPPFTPTHAGPAYLQLVYGNGAGSVSTGITCAVKRVTVRRVGTDEPVATGHFVMPHAGTWDRWLDSNFVPVELDTDASYVVSIDGGDGAFNMSFVSHFARYTGGAGGVDGPFNRVNITELKILGR